MRLLIVTASVALVFCAAFDVWTVRVQGQVGTPQAQTNKAGPEVSAWTPRSGSVDSVIYLSGYRLYPGEWEKTKAFFIQNGKEFSAQTAGGWSTSNNLHNGPQMLSVTVPEEVVPGQAQIVVEFEGRRSNPASIAITEWKLPVLTRLNPKSGAPGTPVRIEGSGFHVGDEIEITDDEGKLIKLTSGWAPDGTYFMVPKDTREGILTLRIGNPKHGKGQSSEAVTFTVTNEPLSVELWPTEMDVAPGQWLDLQMSNGEPLRRSELTEVAFKQAGQTIIVAAPKPFRPHIKVPSALAAGEVELQLRTWRDGKASQWSEPATFRLADKPSPPMIDSIRLEEEQFVALNPGPERQASFNVSAGEKVVLHGLWPVADGSKLKVLLVRAGEVITMTASDFDEKANWFGDVQVNLPEVLPVGEWRMIVSSETDGTQVEVPIVIRVVKK